MNGKRLSELRYKGYITDNEYKELKLALEEVKEWHKLKLICANEGIMVYKIKETENEDRKS